MKLISWRTLSAAPFSSVGVTPALAEVCDKVVGDAWSRGDGPVWLLNPGWSGAGIILTIAAVVSLGYMIFAPRLGYVLAVVFVVLALWEGLLLAAWFDDRDIFDAAVHEGCLSAPTKSTGVLLLLALAAISVWRRLRLNAGPSTDANPGHKDGSRA